MSLTIFEVNGIEMLSNSSDFAAMLGVHILAIALWIASMCADCTSDGRGVFTEGPVRNYRDACKASQRVFMAYWYGMLERGIIPQCYGRDDAWTLTLAHSHRDIERVISAFDDLAGLISEVQRGSEIEAARTTK